MGGWVGGAGGVRKRGVKSEVAQVKLKVVETTLVGGSSKNYGLCLNK